MISSPTLSTSSNECCDDADCTVTGETCDLGSNGGDDTCKECIDPSATDCDTQEAAGKSCCGGTTCDAGNTKKCQ